MMLYLLLWVLRAVILLPGAVACICRSQIPRSPVDRDVVILGGGATGTYTAVRLMDEGKTVAIVEQGTRLGGHVNTIAEGSGAIDYGVQVYINNTQTRRFFERFNVKLDSSMPTYPNTVADFSNGVVVSKSTPNPLDYTKPLWSYRRMVSEAFPFLADGAYDLPDPVPGDLLLPFGDFMSKYNMTEAIPMVKNFAVGVSNILDTTTLYVLQNFGQPHVDGLLSGFVHAPSGNQAVFDAAAKYIGRKNIFCESRAQNICRGSDGIQMDIGGAATVTLRARKLLVTIPPTLNNLAPFDLDDEERAVFQNWESTSHYVGVITSTNLQNSTNYVNTNSASPQGSPDTPYVRAINTASQPGFQAVEVVGEQSSDAAMKLVTSALSKLTGSPAVSFVAWQEHQNVSMAFPTDRIREGLYRRMYALQGQKSTHWTGGAWYSDYSSLLWASIENRTLPALLN